MPQPARPPLARRAGRDKLAQKTRGENVMGVDIDLARATASDLAAALRAKAVSAVELVDASIARIEGLDGPINAVVVRDFERARAEAKAADLAIAAGASRPLLGVPMTVKESYDLRGHPSTWGMPQHREHRARTDALAVQRLTAAGAIMMGKTNVPPVLADWQSDNPVYGRTSNPHDLSRTPGGSSGGSAAAVAMGFSALEMGSDIGGSVRVPAAFCGVFGHKASYNLIPTTGHGMGGATGMQPPLAVLGPLARSAQDLDLALGVVSGPDALSPANRLALPEPRRRKLGEFRVFILDPHPAARPGADVLAAIERVADHAAAEGAVVARQSNLLPDMPSAWKTYQALLHTITSRRAPGEEAGDRPPISAHEWMNRLDEQHRLRVAWADFFQHFDVVVTPAFSTPAFPHTNEPDWRKRTLMIDGEPTNYGAQLAWASMASVGNLPATVAPMGVDADGLPVAVQIIGPHLEDRTSIAFAGLVAEPLVTPKAAR